MQMLKETARAKEEKEATQCLKRVVQYLLRPTQTKALADKDFERACNWSPGGVWSDTSDGLNRPPMLQRTLESCCNVCNRTNRNITQGSSVKSICDNDRCMLMIVGAWSVHQKVEKRTQLGEHMQIIGHATDADPTENYQANDEDATRKNVTTKWKASAELALLFNMWKGNIPKIHVALACHEL